MSSLKVKCIARSKIYISAKGRTVKGAGLWHVRRGVGGMDCFDHLRADQIDKKIRRATIFLFTGRH